MDNRWSWIAVCVKDHPEMTIGKKYTIEDVFWRTESNLNSYGRPPVSTYVSFKNDNGVNTTLPKSYFTTVDLYRNILIDQIGS